LCWKRDGLFALDAMVARATRDQFSTLIPDKPAPLANFALGALHYFTGAHKTIPEKNRRKYVVEDGG
jgi:hypothetical protein